jgi:drug/metabolite transporter (DMT)-like permease
MTSTQPPAVASADPVTRGLAWGALGVLIFALTVPMTRLAVGDHTVPQLPPAFVTAGRAALAGVLAVVYLVVTGARRPPRTLWPTLATSALGTVVGFPLCLAIALREVAAMHAAVVTGVLPLATAVVGALVARQRPSAAFWAAAVTGCALVLAFAAWQGGGAWVAADGWLGLAVLTGAIGYVAGARAGARLSAPQVISWVLVGSLPLTLPATLLLWPTAPASAAAWAGFAYTGVFSMWLGFFAWYHGLALGGVVRVSQVQLLQPFLALVAAALLLGEPLEPVTVGFALAVLAVVAAGRRTTVRT